MILIDKFFKLIEQVKQNCIKSSNNPMLMQELQYEVRMLTIQPRQTIQ